ncbi:hypothetical protein G7046_g1436 [Stylonectria norvegica]|nr:hypothetical protein G7046_g1436 [Stylonectria norvegica]
MTRSLTTYDEISIAEIVIYSIFLVAGVFLCIKHGIRRSAGFRFIVILSLARLIGSAMELATINDPTNKSLLIGWLTTNGVGLGPLILILLGLLSRLFDSINRQRLVVKDIFQRAVHILMLVALILLIVGGTSSTYTIVNGKPKITYNSESKAGAALMIVVMLVVYYETFLAIKNKSYVEQGENRIIIAVLASLPFVTVRLAYTCVIIFANKSQNKWLYLGAGVIMEMFVILICCVVGFSLDKARPVSDAPATNGKPQQEQSSYTV